MANIWITYSWEDNKENQVDYIEQELNNVGLKVKRDSWVLEAGKRLWEQIENFIQNHELSDAWLIYATPNSLSSEACKEELAYALNRALESRGETFPIIALFPSQVDKALIPAAIKIRLYVSLTDPHWKERIKASAEGCSPSITKPEIDPYIYKIHENPLNEDWKYAIEVRPRAGTWSPFVAQIPLSEKDEVNPRIMHGPSGRLPEGGMLFMSREGESESEKWWIITAQNEASPINSYFVYCNKLPTILVFGIFRDSTTLYQLKFENSI